MYQRAIACFRRQRQHCVQFIKLSSRAERRNYHNWMRRGSHFQRCAFIHTHTRKNTKGEARLTWDAWRRFQVFSVEMLDHNFTFLRRFHPATAQREELNGRYSLSATVEVPRSGSIRTGALKRWWEISHQRTLFICGSRHLIPGSICWLELNHSSCSFSEIFIILSSHYPSESSRIAPAGRV